MRRLPAASIAWLALSGVSCSAAPPGDGPHGVSRGPIVYGTDDTAHTAVVTVLAPAPTDAGQDISECSGTIVGVSGGNGYVLTAAHCCNTYVPTVVVVSSNYTVGEQYVYGGTPVAPAYPVVSGSVSYDPQFSTTTLVHDFCMLQFSGATPSTPTLALPASTDDGLAGGVQVEHVGFGVTQSGANETRMTGTDTVGALSSLTLSWNQGGSGDIPGICAGDSGGPALLPAAASQGQQVVVGVTSYSNNTVCTDITSATASRVSSAIGQGAFITSYLPASVAPPPPVPAASPLAIAALALGLLAIGAPRKGRAAPTAD